MKRSLLLFLSLGACVGAPRPPAPPVIQQPVTPVPPPAPPPIVAWEDRARTPGNWTLVDGRATFAGPTGAEMLALRCAGADILLTFPALSAGTLTIRTTTLARTLQVGADGQTRIGANDPLLDAMIYSRGRFMLFASGQADLIIPPWPEFARVVEDCRR